MNQKLEIQTVQTLNDAEEWCKKFQVNVYFYIGHVAVARTVNGHTKSATGHNMVDAVNAWLTSYGKLLLE